MTSRVWVLSREGNYIRGSEIIEVKAHVSRMFSYGKEIKRGTVKATQARHPDPDAGTTPRQVDLWKFQTPAAAETAVQALLAALSTDPCAVVSLDEGGDVQVDPLD